MEKKELEEVITNFMENKFNVLVCTTIIESGIDMPNVNTLFINNSQKFGLSQLYQMRGRIGRSEKVLMHTFYFLKVLELMKFQKKD